MAEKNWVAQSKRYEELSGYWEPMRFVYKDLFCGIEYINFREEDNPDEVKWHWYIFRDYCNGTYDNYFCDDIDEIWSTPYFYGKSLADLKEEGVIY